MSKTKFLCDLRTNIPSLQADMNSREGVAAKLQWRGLQAVLNCCLGRPAFELMPAVLSAALRIWPDTQTSNGRLKSVICQKPKWNPCLHLSYEMRATLRKSLPAPVVTPHCYLELTFSVIHPTIGKQAGKVFITQETMQMGHLGIFTLNWNSQIHTWVYDSRGLISLTTAGPLKSLQIHFRNGLHTG